MRIIIKNEEPFDSNDWSREEDKKLIEAIEKVLGTNDLKDKLFVNNISWIKVQKISGLNRNGSQSFNHWNRKLKWKLANFDLLVSIFSVLLKLIVVPLNNIRNCRSVAKPQYGPSGHRPTKKFRKLLK